MLAFGLVRRRLPVIGFVANAVGTKSVRQEWGLDLLANVDIPKK